MGVLTSLISVGSDSIQTLFDDVEPVITRNLEVKKDDEDGYWTITNDDDSQPFRILQVSDVHFGSSMLAKGKDRLALTAVKNLVTEVKPDLVVLTGDILYPSFFRSGSINNERMIKNFGTFMEKLDVYWAPIFGNHDAESFAKWNKTQLSEYYESLDKCLFQSGPDDVDGSGNYIIKLLNSDGSLNTALFMMDSQAYLNGNMIVYDCIHDNQVDWYCDEINRLEAETGQPIQSILYEHIPDQAYKTAWNLYQDGSDEVTYHFGVKNDGIHSAKKPGKIWNAIVEKGSTKAIFCGHDHENNFSITYKGVQLTYGLSIDYTAYPTLRYKTAQRGGTLLKIENDKTFSIKHIYQDDNYIEQ